MGRGKRSSTGARAVFELPPELRDDTVLRLPGQDREFVVRVVKPGERYGRNRVLVNEGPQSLVCFFDAKNRFIDGDLDERHYGQATGGQYYLSSVLGHDPNSHLDLHGGVPEWTVPATSVPALLDFLRRQLPKPPRGRLSPLAERRAS